MSTIDPIMKLIHDLLIEPETVDLGELREIASDYRLNNVTLLFEYRQAVIRADNRLNRRLNQLRSVK